MLTSVLELRFCSCEHGLVVAPPTGDYQMPSKGEIKDRQDAVARGQVEVATPLGTVTRGGMDCIACHTKGAWCCGFRRKNVSCKHD